MAYSGGEERVESSKQKTSASPTDPNAKQQQPAEASDDLDTAGNTTSGVSPEVRRVPNPSATAEASTEESHAAKEAAGEATDAQSRNDLMLLAARCAKMTAEVAKPLILDIGKDAMTALKKTAETHLIMIKAMHRTHLQEMTTEIAENYLPKIVLQKTRAIDEALTGLKQESKTEIKEEVRACVKEFIWRDIKKQPKDVKSLEERIAQLEPLAIRLTNANTALTQRNADLESKTTELSNKVAKLTEDMAKLHRA